MSRAMRAAMRGDARGNAPQDAAPPRPVASAIGSSLVLTVFSILCFQHVQHGRFEIIFRVKHFNIASPCPCSLTTKRVLLRP